MIQSLKIRNFQAHKNIEIEFDPRVTTIIGPSDRGKSSIIRALRWLAQNRPRGDAFCRTGSKSTSVILHTTKNKIKRMKGKSNTYHLNDAPYKAFNQDVPTDISDVLNISDINFQSQHDSPFWFSKTAGEVSRQLNQIVDLDIMDKTLANLASKLRKTRAEETVSQERLKTAKEKRRNLKSILSIDKLLGETEQSHAEMHEIRENMDALGLLHRDMSNLSSEILRASEAITEGKKVLVEGAIWNDTRKKVNELENGIFIIKDLIKTTEKEIPDLTSLDKLFDKINSISSEIKSLENLIENVTEKKVRFDNISRELKTAQKEFEEKVGDTCPLCNQKIK